MMALLAWVLWAEVSNSNNLETVRQTPIETYETKAECEAAIQSVTGALKNMQGLTVFGEGAWSINNSDGRPNVFAALTCFPDSTDPRRLNQALPRTLV
jgi:hypothetical protein